MQESLNDTNNQQERLIELAWLAGLWEGEGNLSIVQGSKNRLFPRVMIVNTDFKLIEAIMDILKKCKIGHYIQLRRGGGTNNPKHKDAKTITIIGAKRVTKFLDLLMPFFKGHKLEVAKLLKGFLVQRIALGTRARYCAEDYEYVKKIRALNKKGPSESSETICQPLELSKEDIVQFA